MTINVFYLDDEPELCEIFAEEFSNEEIVVTTFTDANSAISAVEEHNPDIIFLDYRLPSTNGDEVARTMPIGIPKYLVTGEFNVTPQYKFVGILRKPFERPTIRQILEAAIEFKKR